MMDRDREIEMFREAFPYRVLSEGVGGSKASWFSGSSKEAKSGAELALSNGAVRAVVFLWDNGADFEFAYVDVTGWHLGSRAKFKVA